MYIILEICWLKIRDFISKIILLFDVDFYEVTKIFFKETRTGNACFAVQIRPSQQIETSSTAVAVKTRSLKKDARYRQKVEVTEVKNGRKKSLTTEPLKQAYLILLW
jgi:hypothetical protein